MPTGATARRSLPFPKTTDSLTYCANFEALAASLDNDIETAQGTEAERSAAKTRGREFFITGDGTVDKNNMLWWDTGSGWIPVQNQIAQGATYHEAVAGGTLVERTPSLYRAAWVVFKSSQFTAATEQHRLDKFYVGGVLVATIDFRLKPPALGKLVARFVSFLVPAGVTWQAKAEANAFLGSGYTSSDTILL